MLYTWAFLRYRTRWTFLSPLFERSVRSRACLGNMIKLATRYSVDLNSSGWKSCMLHDTRYIARQSEYICGGVFHRGVPCQGSIFQTGSIQRALLSNVNQFPLPIRWVVDWTSSWVATPPRSGNTTQESSATDSSGVLMQMFSQLCGWSQQMSSVMNHNQGNLY